MSFYLPSVNESLVNSVISDYWNQSRYYKAFEEDMDEEDLTFDLDGDFDNEEMNEDDIQNNASEESGMQIPCIENEEYYFQSVSYLFFK